MIDFTSIFLKYPGKWVALKQDEKTVVSASKDAQKVYKTAILKGEKRPVLMRVPSSPAYYIGSI
jgi:hypothetical protein